MEPDDFVDYVNNLTFSHMEYLLTFVRAYLDHYLDNPDSNEAYQKYYIVMARFGPILLKAVEEEYAPDMQP